MLVRLLVVLLLWLFTASTLMAQSHSSLLQPIATGDAIPPDAPLTLYIPALAVHTAVTRFFLDGVSWSIDPWEALPGHLEGTARLGSGNMVLAGHAEYPDGAPAIFHQLTALAAGDRITVMASDTIQHFVVVQLISVDYHDLSVVYPTLVPRLTLLTCDIPSYNPQTGIYQARIVIIAEPAAP